MLGAYPIVALATHPHSSQQLLAAVRHASPAQHAHLWQLAAPYLPQIAMSVDGSALLHGGEVVLAAIANFPPPTASPLYQ
eukprot:gene1428-32231_t